MERLPKLLTVIRRRIRSQIASMVMSTLSLLNAYWTLLNYSKRVELKRKQKSYLRNVQKTLRRKMPKWSRDKKSLMNQEILALIAVSICQLRLLSSRLLFKQNLNPSWKIGMPQLFKRQVFISAENKNMKERVICSKESLKSRKI